MSKEMTDYVLNDVTKEEVAILEKEFIRISKKYEGCNFTINPKGKESFILSANKTMIESYFVEEII